MLCASCTQANCPFLLGHLLIQFLKLALVHKTYTRVLSHVFRHFNLRKSRSIAWEVTHLSTFVKLRTYDWLSLNPLESSRNQNNFRGITIGIGPVWEIHCLSPFILSWPPLWISCFLQSITLCRSAVVPQNLDFMQKAYGDCLFLFMALEAIRKFH